jgi:hypothetical protein
MTELQASRTLVKSPPELWAECSDAASLARHLDGFGEIRITRLEPETAVAWEGERARGTVRIEPAGWGTKVILTAVAEEEQVLAEIPVEAPPEPTEPEPRVVEALSDPPPEESPAPPATRKRFARLRAFWRGEPLASPAPAVEEPPPPEDPSALDPPPPEDPSAPEPPPPEAPTAAESGTEAALAAALDSLGQAHHRPYSRA